MLIATYNINSINARVTALLDYLEERKPDVVCLQELKAPQDKFPEMEIQAAGYHAHWHGQKSWNGVAIITREPSTLRQRGLPGDPSDEQSRYIEVEYQGLVIGGLYLPNGNPAPGPKFDYKLAWMERLITHAASLQAEGKPTLLAGDYNVIPTARDVYKPERWVNDALFRPETRASFERLLSQGWLDALRALHPDVTIYTFWDYFRKAFERDAGLRIDHLLLNPALAPALTGAGVDRFMRGREKPSDHTPTWIELDLSKLAS